MNRSGFAQSTIMWFSSYLASRSLIVNVGKDLYCPGKLWCGVTQGYTLDALLFLSYVEDMPQAVNSDLLLYALVFCFMVEKLFFFLGGGGGGLRQKTTG